MHQWPCIPCAVYLTLAPAPCLLTIHPGAVALAVNIRDVDQELPVVTQDEQGQDPLCLLDELLGFSQGHVLTGYPIDLAGQGGRH